MENKTKQIIAGCLISVAALGVGGVAGANLFPVTNTVYTPSEPVIKYVNNTVTKEVQVPVEIQVTKEVAVDNGNLNLVLDHIYDNDGNVEYLTEDLDDDEVDQIVDRIAFINEVKALAINEVKDNGIDELDKELVFNSTVKLDDSDIERFKVLDEDSDIVIDTSSVDFDNGDAVATVTARFEQDDIKYTADFEVTFEDGEVDDVSVIKESIKVR